MRGRTTITIRRANPSEASLLTELAYESKSYWKYDEEYLEAAREHIKLSVSDIESDQVYLYEVANEVLGFYHFNSRQEQSELIWLFVHPRSIGQGIGKILWNDLLRTIRNLEITEFIIKSDPNAEPFYLKLGATRIGFESSMVNEDMKLPLLKFIDKKPINKTYPMQGL